MEFRAGFTRAAPHSPLSRHSRGSGNPAQEPHIQALLDTPGRSHVLSWHFHAPGKPQYIIQTGDPGPAVLIPQYTVRTGFELFREVFEERVIGSDVVLVIGLQRAHAKAKPFHRAAGAGLQKYCAEEQESAPDGALSCYQTTMQVWTSRTPTAPAIPVVTQLPRLWRSGLSM